MTSVSTSVPCRAVVVTALPVEFNAVCEHLVDRCEDTHPEGTVYERGYFRPGGAGEWEVIVAEVGAGNVGAAAEVERAINYFQPNVVVFVGVAGGVKDVDIGDVVAGEKVYGYESGKESGGFKPRPMVQKSNYRLIQRAKAEARTGKWRQRILGKDNNATPRALIGAISAGEKVVADTSSQTSQLIAGTYGDTLAVEMEGYGFLHGAYLNQSLPALVVRGISDLLDGKANADRTGSQERASQNASAFCFEVLAKLGICPGESEGAPDPEAAVSITITGIQQTLSGFETRFQTIEKAIGLRAIVDVEPVVPGSRYETEMNSARDLLRAGHGYAARSILERLRSEADKESYGADLRFRLETNLGGAALLVGEYEAAEPHFEAALRIKPEDPKAIANRAQIALVRDEPALAIDYAAKAWSLAPEDPHVASTYLRALDASGRREEARQLSQNRPSLRSDAEGALVLALIEFEDKRYAEAEALARASLAAEPADPQVMELIARCIIVPLQTELNNNPPLPGKLPTDVVDRAYEAESLFSKAISALEHQDQKELLKAAIANRGMVLSLLGRHAEALSDYDRVLSQDPSQQLVKVNKARLLLSTGRPHEAEQLFEGLDDTIRAEAWHPVAVAYLATGQPKKALQVLLPLWASGSDRVTRIRLAELILEAYSDLTDHDAASAVADTLEAEFPGDPEAISVSAEWRASQPDGLDRAITLFYGALDAADSRLKDRITLSLADVYYKARRFSESADLYGKLVPFFDHPAVFRRYLLSLFNAGLHRQALKVAIEKRGGGRALPLISAIEAHLLEAVGDLDGAERLLVELIGIEPDNPDHRIGLAYLRYRRGDYAGSKEAVLGVAVEEVKGSAHQLLALAKVRAWLELDGVLELAYRARRVGFDSAEAHQGYVSLFLHRKREQDAKLQVDQIRSGTTVHLEGDDGRQRVFTIVDGLDADLHRGELLPSDPVALRLIGRVLNDSVTLKQSELETVAFRIAKIESQYVFAFQETLLNFSTWFPDESKGLEKLTVDGGGIDKIFQMVGRRHAYVESVLELYRANRITLGMLAKLVGRSLIQIWSGLQEGGETRIIASTGQEEVGQLEAQSLAQAQELVLDLSAILTFAALELLPALKRRFKVLLTTQFAFDEISDELTLERAGLRNAGSLYLRGDRYVMESAPAVTSEQRRVFLENIAEFLKSEVCRLPAPGLLDLPQDQQSPLGKSALASIFLARERGALFCSDDLVLRIVAQNTWGVIGVWSQTVIMEMLRSGCISESEYHRATMGLVQRNYTFVRVNEQDYLWLLREEKMRVTPRFVSALTVLEGPACTEESAVIVAGAFLRDICLEPELRRTRYLLIDACISALKHGRQPGIVLSRLEAHVQRLMSMNPEGFSEIRNAISLWKREADLLEEKVRIVNRESGDQTAFHNPRRQRAPW